MKPPVALVEFARHDPAEVIGHMSERAERASGWITFLPAVDPDRAPPPRSALYGLVTARGPDIPEATWAPGARGRSGDAGAVNIGIQHGTGPKAVARLEAAGHGVPEDWAVWQDHPRRGLVVAMRPDVPHDAVLDWLLVAAQYLSAIELDGHWLARIHA